MRGRVRLGLFAGAFFVAVPSLVSGQVVPPPGSEVPIPPKPKTDTAAPKPDTIKSPFGRSTVPHTADIGPQYSWNRDALFASGALSLADLLERVPGAISFRSGWIASPKFVAVNGDLGSVRVYYDGIEIDDLDPRTSPLLDLNTIQLWTLESVTVERFGGELRVHVRSWRVDQTIPYTRTDISTGNEDTNIYRGYYGKRFDNGAGTQLAGQQFSSVSGRFGGGGDALSVMGRLGVARRMWSVDAFVTRTNANRVIQPTFGSGLSLPPYTATSRLAYLRAALGKVDDGPWLELIASNMRLDETSKRTEFTAAPSLKVIADTADTTSSRAQYVIAAGFARDALHFSASDRIRSVLGATTHVPGARVEVNTTLALVSLFAERDGFSKTQRGDVVFRVTPLPFVAVAGAVSRVASTAAGSQVPPPVTSARIEAGVQVRGPWVSGGFITRDMAILPPLRAFDTAYVAAAVGRRGGFFAAVRGSVVGDLGVDIVATRWGLQDMYRPQYQARSEVSLVTRWLSRFPSGNFGLHAALTHEYRGETLFPLADKVRAAASSNVFDGLLEIRVLRGIVSYQIRNMAGLLYQVVPDFYMPRAVSLYGIRWEFSN